MFRDSKPKSFWWALHHQVINHFKLQTKSFFIEKKLPLNKIWGIQLRCEMWASHSVFRRNLSQEVLTLNWISDLSTAKNYINKLRMLCFFTFLFSIPECFTRNHTFSLLFTCVSPFLWYSLRKKKKIHSGNSDYRKQRILFSFRCCSIPIAHSPYPVATQKNNITKLQMIVPILFGATIKRQNQKNTRYGAMCLEIYWPLFDFYRLRCE